MRWKTALKSVKTALFGCGRSKHPSLYHKLRIECLEDRVVPTVNGNPANYWWVSQSGGTAWTNKANWWIHSGTSWVPSSQLTNVTAPGATDTVLFQFDPNYNGKNTANSNVNCEETLATPVVANLDIDSSYTGTLTLASQLVAGFTGLQVSGTCEVEGGTITLNSGAGNGGLLSASSNPNKPATATISGGTFNGAAFDVGASNATSTATLNGNSIVFTGLGSQLAVGANSQATWSGGNITLKQGGMINVSANGLFKVTATSPTTNVANSGIISPPLSNPTNLIQDYGTIQISTASNVNICTQVQDCIQINIGGLFLASAGNVNLGSIYNNGGVVTLAGGTISATADPLHIFNGGTLNGIGTINSSVIFGDGCGLFEVPNHAAFASTFTVGKS
jgi:hypothetical protein